MLSAALGQVFDRFGWGACLAGLAAALTLAVLLAACLRPAAATGSAGTA
jgi:hypothetical protein